MRRAGHPHFVGLLASALAAAGCGGGDDGGGTGGGDVQPPLPRQWSAEQRLGWVLLSHRSREPTMLGPPRCTLDVGLARAPSAGGVRVEASDGPCVRVPSVELDPSANGLLPACAGAVDVRLDETPTRLTVCGERFAAPISLDCATVRDVRVLHATSGPDELPGDELAGLDASVVAPRLPGITQPMWGGDGMAIWPSGPVHLRWEPTGSDGVEVSLGAVGGAGSVIHCLVPDTGSFTVPESLIAPYRAATAWLELASLAQHVERPGGVEVRVTFRRSTAIWLVRL
ncbi:MAG: hypothetical protein NZ898_07355 [Myxococcota bacterium]|nr:hypothetical protein [Myxococcota bacterium]MDW8362135.1 hypothetical protein [Myxococcales bacterium]